jgi:hypothetical protein
MVPGTVPALHPSADNAISPVKLYMRGKHRFVVLGAAGASPGAIGASAIAVQLAASGGAARLLELLATLPKVRAPQTEEQETSR